PGASGAVERARRDAEHLLQLARPQIARGVRAVMPLPRHGTRRFLREIEHLLARAQLLLDALSLGDVAPRPLVALEAALLVEDRFTADAQIPHGTIRRDAGKLQIAERLARGKHRFVLRPGPRQWSNTVELPAQLADGGLAGISRQVIGAV